VSEGDELACPTEKTDLSDPVPRQLRTSSLLLLLKDVLPNFYSFVFSIIFTTIINSSPPSLRLFFQDLRFLLWETPKLLWALYFPPRDRSVVNLLKAVHIGNQNWNITVLDHFFGSFNCVGKGCHTCKWICNTHLFVFVAFNNTFPNNWYMRTSVIVKQIWPLAVPITLPMGYNPALASGISMNILSAGYSPAMRGNSIFPEEAHSKW